MNGNFGLIACCCCLFWFVCLFVVGVFSFLGWGFFILFFLCVRVFSGKGYYLTLMVYTSLFGMCPHLAGLITKSF